MTNAATGGQASEPLSAARLAEIRGEWDYLAVVHNLLAENDRLHAALAAAEAERAQWREIGRAVAAAHITSPRQALADHDVIVLVMDDAYDVYAVKAEARALLASAAEAEAPGEA